MLLTLIVFLPSLFALLVLILPNSWTGAVKPVAAIGSFVVFLLSLWLYLGLLFSGQSFGDVLHPAWFVNQPWINTNIGTFHFQINYALGTDGLSMPMIILNGLLTFLAVVGSWSIDKRPKFYMAMLLFLETGVMGVFASFDLFLFILFWEVELIPMFLLIGIWGGQRREYAAWKFLIYTLVGSSITLAGIFMIYVETGSHNATFQYYATIGGEITGTLPFLGATISLPLVLFLLLFAGFAVKIPMWPVHTWLPDAHTEAPTAVSVLLAGVLLKMGAYGLIRVCLGFVPHGAAEFAPALGIFAAINVLWGAGASMVQRDMKKMIAYSSVSHMGYVLLGVAAAAAVTTTNVANLESFRQAALTGATLQMFTHGSITGMLFFGVGVLYEKAHTRDIDIFGGIAARMPREVTLYSIACFASLGLPALAGFVAEFLIFTGSFATLPVPTILCVFGVVLTAGYLLWMLRRAFYGPLNINWRWLTDVNSLPQFLPLAVLAVLVFFIGVYPALLVNVITPSVSQMIGAIQAITLR